MGLSTKLAFVIAGLALACASVQNVAAQDTIAGRLDLRTSPVVLGPQVKRIRLSADIRGGGPPCCPRGDPNDNPDPVCCLPGNIVANVKKVVKGIGDLGILLIPRRGSMVAPDEISLNIYSGDTKKLLFSTEAKCGGCGSGINLKPLDQSTGYLLTLDNKAATVAEGYFKEGNTITMRFKTRDGRDMPDLVYLVNVGSLNQ